LTNELPSTISILTEAEFFHQVESAQPAVAVFDCDGTLWSGDAGVGFMRWSMESGLLSRDACEWMDTRYRAYLHGEVSELAICGEMVQVYRELHETELRRAAHGFFERTIRPQIFPEMAEICRRLHDKGVTLWAVSSTNNWLIEAAAREFGIPAERVLAACVRVTNGIITQDLVDVPTDEGKAASLIANGVEHPDAVFGNSIHDAAMLSIARRSFAVNPTLALADEAAKQGWPIFQPRRTHA
jgi:phosphoserine phosphatase